MAQEKNQLTQGPVGPALLSFTIPFLLANLLQTLYGTVDTLTVGNFGSTEGLSAVATGAQILSLVTFLTIGLSSGGTVLLGQSIGAGDKKFAAKIVGNVIIDFTGVSLILTLLLYLIYPPALHLLNVPTEAMSEANAYMGICCLGIPLIIGYNIVCALLRAMGDSKSPLLFVGVACLVNIVGDLALTAGLHMGAAGVAIATVVAQGVSFLFSLFFLMKKGFPFPFSRKNIHFEAGVTGRIFRIGLPMGVQSILINLSFMFITAIINAMGLTASAAMGVGEKITGFAFMPQSACASALAVFVAQNIGAKQPDRALSAVKMAITACLAVELVFCLVCQFFPGLLPGLFTKDEAVIEMAGQYMRAYSIDGVLTSITFCMSGLLNGCGKTAYNMTQNLLATFLGRIPATYFLSRLPQANLFWIGLAAPASTVMSIIMLGIFIGRGYWKKGLFDQK